MKAYSSYLSMAATAAMLSFVSCNETEVITPQETNVWVREVVAISKDFVPEVLETRTQFDINAAGGLDFSWADGDILGIYPIGGDQVAFPISDGIGTAEAKFDGGSWALRSNFKYAAYYPFDEGNYHIAMTEIPVSVVGQKQDGNNSLSLVGSYDFQAAAAKQPSSNGSVILEFQHLCCFMKLKLTMPTKATYTHVKVTSDATEFGTTATFDLSAATPSLTPKTTSPSVEMDLFNITTTTTNELVTIYNLAIPRNLLGSKISIEVTDSNGNKYTNDAEVAGKNMLAGHMYGYAATMVKGGTGGTGQGIPGEEEENMINGHEYVDLGLPSGTLWATCNVGAEKPEDYGLYFAWGETAGYGSDGHSFYWDSYKLCEDGTNYTLTKYNHRSNFGTVDYKTVLDLEDDVANANWGGPWRMPTYEVFQELLNNCEWEWTTENGITGCKVSGNGNSIFLPATGYRHGEQLYEAGWSSGNYWSATRHSGQATKANSLFFYRSGHDIADDPRFYGLSVRPVVVKEKPNTIKVHEYVDLGLPSGLKWATCNVGAEKPEDFGFYFAWGETVGYGQNTQDGHIFDWESYKWCEGSSNTLSKYNSESEYGIVDNKSILELSDDAANVNWGGSWRMPTQIEFQELIDNCIWIWTTENGKNGYSVSRNGKSIFLPAAGNRDIYAGDYYNELAFYWSSTSSVVSFPYTECRPEALVFSSDLYHVINKRQYAGYAVRPVTE